MHECLGLIFQLQLFGVDTDMFECDFFYNNYSAAQIKSAQVTLYESCLFLGWEYKPLLKIWPQQTLIFGVNVLSFKVGFCSNIMFNIWMCPLYFKDFSTDYIVDNMTFALIWGAQECCSGLTVLWRDICYVSRRWEWWTNRNRLRLLGNAFEHLHPYVKHQTLQVICAFESCL